MVISMGNLDYITVVAFMVAGSVMAAMIGFMVMNMVYGDNNSNITNPKITDPDFDIYRLNTGVWSNEMDFYEQQLNHSMEPICCKQFPP